MPYAISANEWRQIYIWDLSVAKYRSEIDASNPDLGHRREIKALWLTKINQEQVIVSASAERIQIWKFATGEPIGPPLAIGDDVLLNFNLFAFGLNKGRPLCVSATRDGSIHIWDLEQKRQKNEPFVGLNSSRPTALAVAESDDESIVISGTENGRIQIWNCADEDAHPQLSPVERNRVLAVATATSNNGRHLIVSRGWGQPLVVWDLADGARLDQIPIRDDTSASLAMNVVAGKTMLAFDYPHFEDIWTIEACAVPRSRPLDPEKTGSMNGRPRALAFVTWQGRPAIAAINQKGDLHIFDPGLLGGSQWPIHKARLGILEQWVDVAFMVVMNDLRLITLADRPRTRKIRAWNAEKQTVIEFEADNLSRGTCASFAAIDFFGEIIAVVGTQDGWVELYNVMERKTLHTYQAHNGWVGAVTAGELGGRPVIVSGGNDQHVRLRWLDNGADEAIDIGCAISCLGLASKARIVVGMQRGLLILQRPESYLLKRRSTASVDEADDSLHFR